MYEKEEAEILKIINSSKEPLGTVEVLKKIKSKYKRDKLIKVLLLLHAKEKIKAKAIEGKRSVWIWWKLKSFA
jgi:hypothetical protein